MHAIDPATRYLFFTGKGGVGKTSLACAAAIDLADRGRKVLLVSTDPASNLEHVFGIELAPHEPTSIPGVEKLAALNIDPEAAAASYRERIVGPVRGMLPEKTLRSMEEQLSGACTTEIAAFDEFTALLTDSARTEGFDHVVFDTAPTGHTLRLLKLPSAWTAFLDGNTSGASCLGPLAGLEKQRGRYAEAVRALADPQQTTLLLVTRPETSSLAEADRTRSELADLGVTNQRLFVNGVMPFSPNGDPLAAAMHRRQCDALVQIPAGLAGLSQHRIPLLAEDLIGLDALRTMSRPGYADAPPPEAIAAAVPLEVPSLKQLIDALAEPGRGLVMFMGKGGVGKTTLAAAVAVELASRGHDVHLTTTDPAAHVLQTLGGALERLTVSRIDPQAETARYREHVLKTKGKVLDAQGRALLEEDLRSPCTEEIAVFQAFSRVVGEAADRFVVVDTAPTGHTLLLLDATGAYHREVTRHASGDGQIVTPMMRLQDPQQTKILLVTLAETTPVLEAARLQEDLRRAGIEPWAWVINGSLAAAEPSHPLLARRARAELEPIERVQREMASRLAIVPYCGNPPVGVERLRQLIRGEAVTAQ